jgi:glycogen(starch) synthase
MRILVLSDLYPPGTRGGYEVECHDVVEHLRAVGHDVRVLTSVYRRELAGTPDPTVLRRLPWTGEGTRRETLTSAWDAARAVSVTRAVLREVRPDAIYVWNAGGVPATALRVLQLEGGAPLLVRVCEYWFGHVYTDDQFTRHLNRPPGGGAQGVWDRTMRLAARAVPALRLDWAAPRPVAVCWNAEFVKARAAAPPQFRVAHGAIVIPSNARTTELEAIPRNAVPGRILFVGRLGPTKGAQTLVRALALLGDGDHAHLHLVGDGTPAERAALEALAGEHGVADRVVFTGPLRGDAFATEVGEASCWCVPSVWDEPAPLTCTEAALARVPAVFSRVGGIPEMYETGTQALFHEREDEHACASAIADCLSGGPAVDARVSAALTRGRELSFGPYLEAMDRFLEDGLAALRTT